MQPWAQSQPRHDAGSRSASTALHPDSLFALMERHSVRVTGQVMVQPWLRYAVFFIKAPRVKAVSYPAVKRAAKAPTKCRQLGGLAS